LTAYKLKNKLLSFLLLLNKNREKVVPKSTEVKKELSVKKLVALAFARAAKLAKLNLTDLKLGVNSGWTKVFNQVLLPIFEFYLKFRNNKIYRLFRLVGKIYLISYLITLLLALAFYGHDQFSHAIAFIKFQRHILSEIKDKTESIINYFRKIVTGYEPKPESKGWVKWPGLNEYQSKVSDYEKLSKVVNQIGICFSIETCSMNQIVGTISIKVLGSTFQ
jgi:hypothetical protein